MFSTDFLTYTFLARGSMVLYKLLTYKNTKANIWIGKLKRKNGPGRKF